MLAARPVPTSCAFGARRVPARLTCIVRAANAQAPASFSTVQDVMTTGRLFSVKPEDTVDYALDVLVANRITGLPVLDNDNHVVGVVSDFDLLALDAVGRTNSDLFPSTDESWQAFKEVKKMLAKSAGKKIKDVMTPHPITVRPETNLEDATSILIMKKIRRMPVVDAEGRLVGVISRGNIVKAALMARKAQTQAASNGAAP